MQNSRINKRIHTEKRPTDITQGGEGRERVKTEGGECKVQTTVYKIGKLEGYIVLGRSRLKATLSTTGNRTSIMIP